MIEYEDFSLKIEPRRGDSYPVIVLQSPAGEGRSEFRLPFHPGQIGQVLSELGESVRSGITSPLREAEPGATLSPLRSASPGATITRPQRVGDELFNAIFSGPVLSLFERSIGMLHSSQRGLRVKIHIDPEDPSLTQLASLPWEFLYRKDTRDFLNLSKFTPIVRYLDVQRPFTALPLQRPLRILVVISDPSDHTGLDLARERNLIEKTWARQEGIQVEFMEHASILALQQRLTRRPYHVLHYMGHGAFDEYTGQGVLVMQNEQGLGQLVDGSSLGVLLRDVLTMRLVFLNACDTAQVTREQGLDPFAGVASAMVMAGIPAVVAMQFPISDQAAITFSGTFYPLLAQGHPVDVAVAEGRRAIRLENSRTMEWGTPVLFMRAPKGDIFRVHAEQPGEPHDARAPEAGLVQEADESQERQLAQLYVQGLDAYWQAEWETAVTSFEAITKSRPDYLDVESKLAESEKRARWHQLHAQAEAAEEAEDWLDAMPYLESLVAEAPDYENASARLQAVRNHLRLAGLYTQALQLYRAQRWKAVVRVFARIHALEPDFSDPASLLATAEKHLAEQQRQAHLEELYKGGLKEMNEGAWREARRLLQEVQDAEPSFEDTGRLLARIETELGKEDANLSHQATLGERYAQAKAAAEAGDWATAVSVLESLLAEAPDYKDAASRLAAARLELARQREQTAAKKPASLPSEPGRPPKPPMLPPEGPRRQGEKPRSLPGG
jgi:outer membrane protein assembly factor BamD (BamD/ComL family)